MLVLPTVCADDLNVYKSLILSNVISGDITIEETGSNPHLEYLKADLTLFPKENFQQSILEQSLTTTPEADQTSVTEDTVLLKWTYISDDKASFKLDTKLEIKNDFPKVRKTVDFPISSLDQNIEKYTYETTHIDINSDIKEKANELVAGETDLFMAAYNIASWVKDNIEYDLNTMTADADQKASWVFVNKRGVCDEITNLFIAMLRSVKVPARFVSGIVYSNLDNNFGNHGWAEVYFPGYGWVPFDVTFGQYGWVDASHIILEDSYDSGVPSIEYHWKSRDLDIKAESLEFKTEVKQKNGRLSSLASLEIKPLKEKVKFGSYVPIEVTVTNLNNYYLPLAVFVVKAPNLVEEKNVEYIVLKPNSKKHIYWTVKIPDSLEEEYIYTSELEVKTVFGTVASNTIKYAKTFEHYSKAWAKGITERLGEREQKFFFSSLGLDCKPDKESYYSIEDANIGCSVINTGNTNLDEVNVCMAEECKKVSLGIGEKKDVRFTKSLVKSETLTISAENKEMVRYSEVKLDVIEIPDLQIVNVKPDNIGYDEESILVMSLVTESPAYNVQVHIKNLGIAEWESISDKNFLKVPFEGKVFSDGVIKVHMTYEDKLNKTYTQDRDIPIIVTGTPFYAKTWNWVKNLLFIQ